MVVGTGQIVCYDTNESHNNHFISALLHLANDKVLNFSIYFNIFKNVIYSCDGKAESSASF